MTEADQFRGNHVGGDRRPRYPTDQGSDGAAKDRPDGLAGMVVFETAVDAHEVLIVEWAAIRRPAVLRKIETALG